MTSSNSNDGSEPKLPFSLSAVRSSGRRNLKLAVVGSHGAGKTTFINTIRDVRPSDGSQGTTGAFDFACFTVEDVVVNFFGVPFDKRSDLVLETIGEGMMGFIFLIDSTRPETFHESKRTLDLFLSYVRDRSKMPVVLCANKQDALNALSMNVIAELFYDIFTDSQFMRVLPCIATQGESVKSCVVEMLRLVLASMDESEVQRQQERHSRPNLWSSGSVPPAPSFPTTSTNITSRQLTLEDIPVLDGFLNAVLPHLGHSEFTVHRTFDEHTTLAAFADARMIGVVRFFIEDAVTRVWMVISPMTDLNSTAFSLLLLLEQLVMSRQSEIILVYPYGRGVIPGLEEFGYEATALNQLKFPRWRQAM